MVSLLPYILVAALSLALPTLAVPLPQASVSSVSATTSGVPSPTQSVITFGDLTTPSEGGTFNDFVEVPHNQNGQKGKYPGPYLKFPCVHRIACVVSKCFTISLHSRRDVCTCPSSNYWHSRKERCLITPALISYPDGAS